MVVGVTRRRIARGGPLRASARNSFAATIHLEICLLALGCRGPRDLTHWTDSGTQTAPVTVCSLLGETTDLVRLTSTSGLAYTTLQSSSYDRRSTTPTDPSTWFADHDLGNFIRTEQHDGRTESVMLDVDGPGAIVRIWSADPSGTLRIYLDGGDVPVIEQPMEPLLRGAAPPFASPLAAVTSGGYSFYFPIPYASHCKVTADNPARLFYHVDYRTYARGTVVESYSNDALTQCPNAVRNAEARLQDTVRLDPDVPVISSSFPMTASPLVPAAVRIVAPPGGARLRELRFQAGALDETTLRRTVLRITFDGEPSVLAPLGDFFGTGPGMHAYVSLPFVVAADGTLLCHWPMPFEHEATIELLALDSSLTMDAGYSVESAPWTDASMHFHAQWHPVDLIPTDPPRDWHVVAIDGTPGVFVGLALNVMNPDSNWWGEGDEKIYLDDATFPSWFGTGTEDYFGYGWCSTQPFAHPYHAQTFSEGTGMCHAALDSRGHTSVNRWHVLDAIPFDHHFAFDLEVLHLPTTEPIQVAYDAVAYWYAVPGGSESISPPASDAYFVP